MLCALSSCLRRNDGGGGAGVAGGRRGGGGREARGWRGRVVTEGWGDRGAVRLLDLARGLPPPT